MCVEEILKGISNEGEIWKPCPEFESKYLISSQGRILGIGIYNTCKKGELIKQHQKRGRNSYMQVRLYDNGRAKTMEVHTLVAKAFVPNPYNLPIVNHINENKIDNRVENLEWCTNAYNIRYSDTKAVDVYSKDGEFIETLDAISDVAAKYNTSNPQPIGFSGILLAKRQNSFYCTYFLHNRNVADTKSPYPIKRLEVIRWFNQKSMVFNQSLS